MVVFNSPINFEVAETSLAAATDSGVALVVGSDGNLGLAAAKAAKFDAILISEIVSTSEYKDRYYIYTTIDYGPYVQIGETISVAKGFHGLTCTGIALIDACPALAKGDQLEVGANGKFQKLDAGVAVARVLEATAANATTSNAVHLY